jgi:hypothetical protein
MQLFFGLVFPFLALLFELLMTRSAVINWVVGGSIGVIDHARTVVAEADFKMTIHRKEKKI